MIRRLLGLLFTIALIQNQAKGEYDDGQKVCNEICAKEGPLKRPIYLPSRICSQFCGCNNQVAIVLKCPSGLEFNPKLNGCDLTSRAECKINPTTPRPDISTKPSTFEPEPKTDTPSRKKCIGSCPNIDPIDRSIYLPSGNCSEFCECSNGVAIILSCPPGLEFNPELNVCDWPNSAGCTGQAIPTNSPPGTSPDPTEPTSNPEQPTTQSPNSTSPSLSSNKNCLGSCPTIDPLDRSIYLPSSNCSQFCECSNGVPIVLSCPGGLEFNPKLNVCDWPYRAGCTGQANTTDSPPDISPDPTEPTSNPEQPTTQSPNSTSPSLPSNKNCLGSCPTIDPLDRSIYLPSSNCSQFCECSNGVPIVLSCPRGLEFNPKLNVCDWPYRAGCTGQANTTDSPPDISPDPTEPTSNPEQPTTQSPNSTSPSLPSNKNCLGSCPTIDPLDRSIYLPSSNCSQFCECSNGVPIVLSCPRGLEFNPKLNVCDWPYRAGCTGQANTTDSPPDISPDPTEPTSNPEQPTTQSPNSTSPSLPSNKDCLGSCPTIDPLDRSIYLPSSNCSQFCECSNGVPIVLSCPGGLEFNPKLNVCDWPYRAGCTGQANTTDSPPDISPDPTEPTSNPEQPTTQSPNSTSPSLPSNKNCLGSCPTIDPLDRSIYLPSSNCSQFCECSNGVSIVLSCPGGLEFNPKLNVCDWPYRAGCTGQANPTDSPPDISPDPNEPTSNPEQPTTQSPNSTSPSLPSNKNCLGSCPTIDPLDRSIYLPSSNCSQFCECSNGVPIVLSCPRGLEFNPKLNVCDWPYRAGCTGQANPTDSPPDISPDPTEPTSNPEQPTTQSPNSTSPSLPSNKDCLGSCPTIDPLDRSIYLPSSNCSQFCECSNGVPIVLSCPGGLEFNPKLNVCDWPYRAGCTGQANTTDSPPDISPDPTEPTSNPEQPTTQSPNSTSPSLPSNKNCLGSCPTIDPLDRSIYLPSSNCSQFCECSNGVPIVLSCPRGLEFNPKLNVCDWPYRAGCTGQANTTDSPPDISPDPTEPTSNPEQPTTQSPNSTSPSLPSNKNCLGSCPSIDPLDRSIYLPSSNCSQFCECSNGVSIVLSCPGGLEFNPKLNVCDWPYRAGCTGQANPTDSPPDISPDPTEPTSNPEQPTTQSPNSTSPSLPSNKDCLGSCPTIDPLDRSIYLPSSNCSQFCECSNGVPIVLSCPGGLEFNPKLNVCDWPYRAGCTGQANTTDSPPDISPDPTEPTSNPEQPTTQSPNSTSPSLPSNKNCLGSCPTIDPLDRSIYLPSSNCSQFCECSNGVPIVLSCPRGLEFNPKLNVCDWPYRAGCTGQANTTDSPPDISPDPTEPTSNPEQPTTQSPNSTSPSLPSNKNCLGSCPTIDPLDRSIYLPSSNCSQFCECSNGVPIVLPCPRGLEFNPVLNVCDYPYRAGCIGQAKTTPATCPVLDQHFNRGVWHPAECTSNPSKFGSKCQLICSYGYHHVGSISIICGDSGWRGVTPQCKTIEEIGYDFIHLLK